MHQSVLTIQKFMIIFFHDLGIEPDSIRKVRQKYLKLRYLVVIGA